MMLSLLVQREDREAGKVKRKSLILGSCGGRMPPLQPARRRRY